MTHQITPKPHIATRTIWWIVGWVSLITGLIGVVLPVLPTTPLMILAAFAFSKGSPKMRKWLLDHRFFGDAIREWEAHGAIPPRYKAMACGLMAVTFGVSVYMGLRPVLLIIQASCMIPAALFVLSRPSHAKEMTKDSAGD